MGFASLEFALFMVGVYAAYAALPHRGQNLMLLGASYLFYGAWDWRFLGLIALSTVVDHGVGLRLADTDNPRLRRRLLWLSVGVNLGILGVFKYLGFFLDSLSTLVEPLGLRLDSQLEIILPVGISFYTFQTLSYTVDIYRGELRPTRRFTDFALFVAFFPQLVAGPIERARKLLPQIEHPRKVTYQEVSRGAYLILFGLFKKVVVADGVAKSVDLVYSGQVEPTGIDVVIGTVLFAAQIYCDFSGYSDIARGLAKTLGFELMVNFRLPYFATNASELWRRWHISLSTWLRDYLYIPLGGSRGSTYRNLMATMVLGGLWHGAAWNFVLWGAYQGALLVVHRWRRGRASGDDPRSLSARVARLPRAAAFFPLVCYGWLLFRATSFEQIIDLTERVATLQGGLTWTLTRPTASALIGLVLLVGYELVEYLSGSPHFYQRMPRPFRGAWYAVLLFVLVMGLTNAPTQFIYFQF